MKYELLRRLLDWRWEIDQGWAKRTGAYGKGLKKRVPPERFAALAATYVGPDPEANWQALFATLELFQTVALEVAEAMGYVFPPDLHERVMNYLRRVKASAQDQSPSSAPVPGAPVIRPLALADCEPISAAFTAQGWHKTVEQYRRYYQEALAGRREVLVAWVADDFAGYLNVLWVSDYAPFDERGIPEIADFNVLLKYQRRGIGTALMDAAEQRIAEKSPVAGIGVGLTPDYGAAQVLYVRRGYVPDGRGVTTHGRYITYGEQVPVDDDLVLYFTKALR